MKKSNYILICAAIIMGFSQSCRHEPIEPFKSTDDMMGNIEDDFTFSTGVFPIIENNCVGCHGGANPSAGIPLTTYSEIFPFAASGGLYGVINHEPGYTPMPLGANNLNDSDVNTVKQWIDDGFPNN